MSTNEPFSLERLEFLAYRGQLEEAAKEMLSLFAELDSGHGSLPAIGVLPSGHRSAELSDAHLATRIASAVATLFSKPEFELSQAGFQRLIPLQRWMTIVFGASPLGNADHIIHVFNEQGYRARQQITLTERDLVKFCLLYSLDSTIPLQAEPMWRQDRRMAAALFFALLASRVVATPEAQAKKEQLLEWLPSRLGEISLDDIPLAIVHDVWMHCSYASGRNKHLIKRGINQMIRTKLLASGFGDASWDLPRRDKPVLVCILEWFTSNHAMYRTYSLAIAALKARFRLVGISQRGATDAASHALFDEVYVLPVGGPVLESVRRTAAIAESEKPDIIYYPSVGMFPDTIFLANLRLAPIQMISIGHPATTHSPFIDYAIVEEDYLGDPACFSEKLLSVPPGAIPYRPPEDCPVIAPKVRSKPDPVRVAIAASVMKINPVLLDTLQRIADTSKVAVEFHFFTLAASGLTKVYLENLVRRVLGARGVVYPQSGYAQYIENVNRCDMFVNPFPFGNTNGIVDTVRQGLPGVCMTGPEVHSHIDEGLFRRLGLPDWLITRTPDEYVNAAVRLAENSAEREALARALLSSKPDAILFRSHPELFTGAIAWLHHNHRRLQSQEARIERAPG